MRIEHIYSSSFANKCLVFDGVDEYAKMLKVFLDHTLFKGINKKFSINIVFSSSDLSPISSFFSLFNSPTNGTFNLQLKSSAGFPRFLYYFGVSSVHTLECLTFPFNVNQKHLITYTIDGSNSYIAVDGNIISTSTTISSLVDYGTGSFGDNYQVNGYNLSNSNFVGKIYSLSVLDYAITLVEHQTLYNSGNFRRPSEIFNYLNLVFLIHDNYAWSSLNSRIDFETSLNAFYSVNMEEGDVQ